MQYFGVLCVENDRNMKVSQRYGSRKLVSKRTAEGCSAGVNCAHDLTAESPKTALDIKTNNNRLSVRIATQCFRFSVKKKDRDQRSLLQEVYW